MTDKDCEDIEKQANLVKMQRGFIRKFSEIFRSFQITLKMYWLEHLLLLFGILFPCTGRPEY